MATTDLDGKTVLLTGASGGIGKPTAKILSDAGAFVIAHYCAHESEARRALADVDPKRTLFLHADFLQVGSSRRLWAESLAWRGHVDVLINNAAIMPDTHLASIIHENSGEGSRPIFENSLRAVGAV